MSFVHQELSLTTFRHFLSPLLFISFIVWHLAGNCVCGRHNLFDNSLFHGHWQRQHHLHCHPYYFKTNISMNLMTKKCFFDFVLSSSSSFPHTIHLSLPPSHLSSNSSWFQCCFWPLTFGQMTCSIGQTKVEDKFAFSTLFPDKWKLFTHSTVGVMDKRRRRKKKKLLLLFVL